MKKMLYDFLDPAVKQSIEDIHNIQKELYGVYVPPLLKQLISLRHLLIRTGGLEDKELKTEDLLGLSRIECAMLLKKLNHMNINRLRSLHRNGA